MENHINKNTCQYYLPADKTNIKVKTDHGGPHVLGFMRAVVHATIKKERLFIFKKKQSILHTQYARRIKKFVLKYF